MKIINYKPRMVKPKMPAPFRKEGPYLRIVPDRSFMNRALKVGLVKVMQHIKILFGPDAQFVTSWCIEAALPDVTGLPIMGHLTCLNNESCVSDVECTSHLVCNVNSYNLIVATEENAGHYSTCARLPIIFYNAEDLLEYYTPSRVQIDFAASSEDKRKKQVMEEASAIWKKVQKRKKLLR